MRVDACPICESGKVKPMNTWYVCEECGAEFTDEQYMDEYHDKSIADWG